MSIQVAVDRRPLRKLLLQVRADLVVDGYSIATQWLKRKWHAGEFPKVYYPYYRGNTHPYIRQRMYGRSSPVRWCDYRNANLAHWLQFPKTRDSKPFLVEPNDHILVLCNYFGAKDAREALRLIPQTAEFINSNRCKGILIGNDGLRDQFAYYFGNLCADKLLQWPYMRTLPRYHPATFVIPTRPEGPVFLFLASGFALKGVDLVIDAWLHRSSQHGHLIIACHDVSEEYRILINKVTSITLMAEAPLGRTLKHHLLLNADVSVAFTHADGGANAWEGLEYGHAIITNTYHRSGSLTAADNGMVVTVPNQLYQLGRYGVEWNDSQEYMAIVHRDQAAGKYSTTVQELAGAFDAYLSNPILLAEHRKRSLEYSWQQSLWKSNERLYELYINASWGNCCS